ncbi:MAG: hypothetical protein K1X74_17375 [Pirellulales bacterium]|nr:hypothetical protein [Pirellulales bacterium]
MIRKPNLTKTIHLSGISQFTIENREWTDRLVLDGRMDIARIQDDQAGGLGVFACAGVRQLVPEACLSLFALVGESELGQAHEAVDHLRLTEPCLCQVRGKRTNRSRVMMDARGSRQIARLRAEIDLSADLDPVSSRRLKSQIARSGAVLLGRMSPELTAELLQWGHTTSTYLGLCPGRDQYEALADLRPHALFMNLDEAREVTGTAGAEPGPVFEGFVKRTAASHLTVMTTGPGPVFVHHRPTGIRLSVWPAPASASPVSFPMSVGCGDVLAGMSTYLLGAAGPLAAASVVSEIVAAAQAAASAHYYHDRPSRERARLAYLVARGAIERGAAVPAATAVA